MLSHPVPLLAFERVGAQQLHGDGPAAEITFAAPVTQRFMCAHDALHRIEIFVALTFHHRRCSLWLLLYVGDTNASTSRPLRVSGPLLAESLTGHGWFGFEFEPVPDSAGKAFTFVLQSPDGAPGNSLAVRATSRRASDGGSAHVVTGPTGGSLTFRATCIQSQELWANFTAYRRNVRHPGTSVAHLPLMVRLEASRPCNLGCVMCQRGLLPFDARREGAAFLSLAAFRKLDPLLPRLLRIVGFGLGEPFLNPEYLAILRHARQCNAHVDIFTSTNGTRLPPETVAALVEENLVSELQISLDGNEPATFEAIRRHASFATVVGAFERVAAARQRTRGSRLQVTGAMLVMKPNLSQVLGFVRRMLDLGVDRISLDSPKDAAFAPLRGDTDDEMTRILEQVAAATELLAETATRLTGPLLGELVAWHRRTGQRSTLPRLGFDECAEVVGTRAMQAPACNVPWQSFSLAADGTIRVCCNSLRRMGDGAMTPSATWTDSAAYAALRRELLDRTLHVDCRTCLRENVAMPDEAIPVTYLASAAAANSGTEVIAGHLGRSVTASHVPESHEFTAEVDVFGAPAAVAGATDPVSLAGVLHAKAAPAVGTPPRVVAIAVDGAVRALATATFVSPRAARWSTVVAGQVRPHRPDAVSLYTVERGMLCRVPVRLRRAPQPLRIPYADLHGFVDEVLHADGCVHFRGWARDRRGGPADRVMLTIAGTPFATVQPWLPRPDVSQAFSDGARWFGYTLHAALPAISRAGCEACAIVAVDAEGAGAPLEWSDAAVEALRAVAAGPAHGSQVDDPVPPPRFAAPSWDWAEAAALGG